MWSPSSLVIGCLSLYLPLFQPVGGVAQEVFHLPHLWGRLGMEAVADKERKNSEPDALVILYCLTNEN